MWPNKVLLRFQGVPPIPKESDFYGPYNKLLHSLFPWDSDFTVSPQYEPDSSQDSIDFIVGFQIEFMDWPVLILELKRPSTILHTSTRGEADDQIRERMEQLVAQCPLQTLHAVSVLGTSLCFYSLDTRDTNGKILPLKIPRHPTVVNDYAPENQWEYDVLGEEGEAKLRDIIVEVSQGCADLLADT